MEEKIKEILYKVERLMNAWDDPYNDNPFLEIYRDLVNLIEENHEEVNQ